MSDKRKIHSTIGRIEKVKTWQLVILLLMAGFVAATFLRLNNVGMIERRDAVLAADAAGNDTELERRLYDLQRYVTSRMNTDPGRVPLEGKYARDNQKHIDEAMAAAATSSSNDVVIKVKEYCDALGRQQGWRWTTSASPQYVACINEQWAQYPAASTTQEEITSLPTAPYYHTFVSPAWSPDFAGWSLVACALILLVIVVRLITLLVLKLLLKRQYRQV